MLNVGKVLNVAEMRTPHEPAPPPRSAQNTTHRWVTMIEQGLLQYEAHNRYAGCHRQLSAFRLQ